MAEYYIRREGDEDASGPFDMDQIVSLVEAEKLDTEAYYYDIDAEDWVKLADNKEMMDTLFPKKRKLSLKGNAAAAAESPAPETEAPRSPKLKKAAKEETAENPAEEVSPDTEAESPPPVPVKAEEAEAPQEDRRKSRRKSRHGEDDKEEEKKLISVETMLAQAEGRPENDPSGRSPVEKQAQAAMIGLRMVTFFVLASVVAMAYLELDLLKTADVTKIFKSPYTIIAAFDALLGLFLILGVTEVFSVLRLRAAFGGGLLTVLFLASGDPLLALCNALIMMSVYACTVLINIPKVMLACIPGLAGVAGYVYMLILPQV